MPLNVTKLANKRAPLTVDFGGGESLDLEYYPDRITAKVVLASAASQAAAGSNDAELAEATLNANADMLLTILASWQAVQDDDAGNEVPYPLTRDNLLAFSLRGTALILKAITEDASGVVTGKSAASTVNG